MVSEHMNHARNFLKKAQEYLAAAEDSLAAERHTPAAGDAIHAGINAKDAIVTALTGTTSKSKNHSAAAGDLKQALGQRPGAGCDAVQRYLTHDCDGKSTWRVLHAGLRPFLGWTRLAGR